MFISSLRVCNFLSFVGEHEVSLKPFSAIMFSTEKGKNDFCMALLFLFGRSLVDLGVDSLDYLYHESFIVSKYFPDLEVSAVFDIRSSLNQTLQISRAVRNGRMVYMTDQNEINYEVYKELIQGMRCDLSIRFSFEDFVEALWDYEGIETVLTDFFRADFKYHDLQRELERIKVTEIALKMQNEKHSLVMVKQRADVDKVVDEYQKNLQDLELRRQNTIKILVGMNEEIRKYEPHLPLSMDTQPLDQQDTVINESSSLDDDYDEHDLMNSLSKMGLEESKLSGSILYNEAKLVTIEDDVSRIQEKIAERYELESRIQKLESDIQEIWLEMSATDEEIAIDLAEIEQIRDLGPACVKRLTAYGRLIDWIQPGQFFWIFRAVLGEQLLNANLVDDQKDAEEFIACLKDRFVSSRQTFIILSNYSPKLKEVLFEAGEKGLVVKNYTEVLTLLSKFREYELIDSIPVLVTRGEMCLEALIGDDEVIFTSTGDYTSEGGIFGRHAMSFSKDIDVLEILSSVNEELQRRDMLFELVFEKISEIFKLRLNIGTLAKGERFTRSKTYTTKPASVPVTVLPEIYQEYEQLFVDYENSLSYEEIIFESWETDQTTDVNKTKNDLEMLKAELAKIEPLKKEKEEELRSAEKRLNRKLQNALKETLVMGNPFIQPQPEKDKSAMTLASQMAEIEKIIKSDEAEELKAGVQWRNMVLEDIRMELNRTKREANNSRKVVENLIDIRLKELTPFVEFCNKSMDKMLQEILGKCFTCELRCVDEETLKMFVGFKNKGWIDVMDCSVFLRCVSLLVLFLHAASYRKGALLVVDEMSDFFPKTDDDAKCVLGELEITRFDLMLRVGHAVHSFLQKIHPSEGESPKNEDLMNLDQVLLFTSDDLAASTDDQVIIVQDILNDSAHGSCVISAMMNV